MAANPDARIRIGAALTLGDLVRNAAGEEMMEMTMEFYCKWFIGEEFSPIQSQKWQAFKNVLAATLAKRDYHRTMDEMVILLSKDAWRRLWQAWWPGIAMDKFRGALEASRSPDKIQEKLQEDFKREQEFKQVVVSGNVTRFSFLPAREDDWLAQLGDDLNIIRVFNKEFTLLEQFGNKPLRHLRMDCGEILQDKVKEFIKLLNQCGVTAQLGKKGVSWLVVIKNVDYEKFSSVMSAVTKFAQENRAPEQRPSSPR